MLMQGYAAVAGPGDPGARPAQVRRGHHRGRTAVRRAARRGVVVLRHRHAAEHRHGARPGGDRRRERGRRRLAGDAEALTCSTRSRASPTAATGSCSSWRRCSCCSPPRSAARSSRLLDSDDDFEDHASESVLARDAVERATGRSGVARPGRARAARRGRRQRRRRRQKIARVAGALRDPGVADVVAVPRRRPARARLARRPLDLRARHVPLGRRRGRAGRAPAGPRRARAGRHRGRRPARVRPGLRAGAGGPRARGAARLPAALPALARRLPQRRRGAAAGDRRRDDDPHDVRVACGWSTRSSRCRCSRST